MTEPTTRRGLDRRAFIKSSAGAAAAATPVAIALGAGSARAADAPGQVVPTPDTDAPAEPVIAYVHDAKRGEVTVVSGTSETTYRDPALARRLLDAAAPHGKEGV